MLMTTMMSAMMMMMMRTMMLQVNMRKRERTREQAAELRQMQKLFLLKAMANPGQPVGHHHHQHYLRQERDGDHHNCLQVAEQPDLDGSGAKANSRMRQTNSKLSRLL